MAYQVTKKQAKLNAVRPIAIGYCSMQNLLRYRDRDAFTVGIYGWNFDIFNNIYGRTITTGYRGMFGDRVDYEVLKDFESKAEEINCDLSIVYDEKKKLVENLLKEFISRLD